MNSISFLFTPIDQPLSLTLALYQFQAQDLGIKKTLEAKLYFVVVELKQDGYLQLR